METFNLLMQTIGYCGVISLLGIIAFLVFKQPKTYAKRNHLEDDELHSSFENWLTTYYQWNGCGWVERHRIPSAVKTTEHLYDHFVNVNYNSISNTRKLVSN
jgi:hypothetical protein